ncbi:MAG: SdrD B-like domain-containing protein, partial [Cyanobacteria bacterium J06633_8]
NFDTADFGFSPAPTGSIGDTVYRDNNNNNVQDEGDTGIPGVQVTLTSPGADGQLGTPDDTTQTTTTNEQGIYNFPNLPGGNYQVTSATPDGLTPTQTQANPVELQPGQNIDTVDFGFSPSQGGTIGDRVYRDDNGDGTQNEGEPGIPNVEVTLINPGPDGQFGTPDDTTTTTTTDENGTYSFPDIPPGNYQVVVNNPPDGLTPTQTPPQTVTVQPGENFDTADFGFSPAPTGSIGDTVYTDENNNNQQDEGETGIPGATVTLTGPGADGQLGTPDDTTQTTTTNEQGIYNFPNLPAGNYRVTATSPREGDNPTQTQPDTVELQPGQNLETVDFGFAPGELGQGQSIIGDTVYNDTNRNNQQDDGETGIPGVTVTLTNPGEDGEFGTPDDTTQTTTTNENGNYSFPNLPAGNYRVTTTTPDGLTPTQTPPDTVSVGENQNLDTVDFGFAPQQDGTGSIGDTVYNDTNSNNQQDDGETGIPGVTVTLTGPGPDGQLGNEDDTTQTTTTDNNGVYGFTNLPPANYRVTTTTPDGLTPTQTQPDVINLQGGQNIDTIDFGFAGQQQGQGTVSIGDTVYNDLNNNGQQDEGEPGIPGVVVNYAGTGPDGVFGESLTDDDTSGRTSTDANGRYTFPNLPAETYRITINDPSQQPIRELSQTQIPNNPITLNAGDNFLDADFGFTQPTGTIGDTVYQDNNSDGTQNQGEPGIPNVVVTLTRPGEDGQLDTPDDTTDTTTTNENGNYSFPNVPIGNYRVTVNNPPENLSPTQTPPSSIALQPGQNFDTADFGFSPQQVGTIGDFVFFDNNGNSTPDGDESGISGITLVLRDGNGNEIARTTTAADGSYNFVAPPGTYTVTVDNPPQGLAPTLTQPNPVTLQAGQNIDTVDFGFQPPLNGSIGDTVFADANGNGTQDPGEPGVSGVLIRLVRPGQDGVFGTSDDQIDEQRTDNTETVAFNANTPGQYTFNNLPPGNYQVQMVLPDGSILTTGSNPISVDLQPSQNLDSADFGIRMTAFTGENPGSIGDEVFNDTDGDGVRDEGEPGVPNVTVTLTQPGPDGQLDTPDDTTQTTTTNDQGNYTFGELPPGPYRVSVTPPANLPEATNPGGSQIETNLQPGQDLTNVDFGLRGAEGGSIGDTVFNDENGDEVQNFTDSNNNGIKEPNEEGEAGIPGVQLTLRDSQGNQVGTTTTDSNGNYTFNGLPLGNYTVESATPNNLSPTTETTLSAQLTEENPNTNEVDFGFRGSEPGSIGDTVFRDENGDGVQNFTDSNNNGIKEPNEEGEAGIPGVQVTLRDAQGNEVGTTTTNENGNYTFNNLPLGDYTVESATPEGAFSPTTQTTLPAQLSAENPTRNEIDFGFRPGGSIGDTVFVDANGDGIQNFTDSNSNGVKEPNEEGEEGIPGVEVTLRDAQGNQVATTTTNDNGNYTFNGLPLANYTVEAARPSDFSPTTDNPRSAELTEENPSTNEVDFGFRPGLLGASAEGPVNLRLVKRITAINQQRFTTFEDADGEDDNELNPIRTVEGIFQQSQANQTLTSGDIIEYTIYFLKEGADELQNVRVCDLLPAGTTFVDSDIQVEGVTGANSQILGPTAPIPTDFANICRDNANNNLRNGTPTEGAVLVNLGNIGTGIQTGFIRFRVQVK